MQRTLKQEEKLKIPHALKIRILKIQVEEDTDWISACEIAATMLDPENEKRRIANEARRLMNSEMMKQLNFARATVEKKAYEHALKTLRVTVLEEIRENEDNFRIPCVKCGKTIYVSSLHARWKEVRPVLYNAFNNWVHTECSP